MSAVATAVVHPRRKLGQAKLGRGTQALVVTKRDLENLMHLRLSGASKQLGISATTVKKVCRTLGIHKWGNESFREHCAVTPVASPRSSSSDASAHDNEHTRRKAHFNGVPAPLPVADAMHIDSATPVADAGRRRLPVADAMHSVSDRQGHIDSATPKKLEHASSREEAPGFQHRVASHGELRCFPASALPQPAHDVASDFSGGRAVLLSEALLAHDPMCVSSARAEPFRQNFTPDATSWSSVHCSQEPATFDHSRFIHHAICAAIATPEMPPPLVGAFSDIEGDDDFASIARYSNPLNSTP